MSFEEAKKLDDHFVMHTFARKPVLLVEGSGMEVKDDEGKTYLDFIAGIGVDSLGHCHPAVVRAIQDQAAKLIHVSNYYYIEQRGEVAKLLSDMLNVCVPKFFRAPWPVFFANSGAEANECAIKLARLYSKKMGGGGQTIITMDRSFHGRTLATLAATAQPAKQEAFQPLPGGFLHVPMNDLNALHQAVYNNLADVCAVMIEPVQGEAGVRPPVPGYLEALRRRCDEVGALLVFDEIQTGMGRTGALFAMLKYGVAPDIVCLAKAFGGGMPLGAFAARPKIMQTLQENPVLGHITTFGGHPVCCAAGLAALNYLLDNKVVEGVEAKGALYAQLLGNHPAVREIRRSGLLLAVELGEPQKLYRIMELFKQAGILSDWFLFCDTAFRISPPLTISEEEIRGSSALILKCLDELG